MTTAMTTGTKKIVIVGGGSAGVYAARALERKLRRSKDVEPALVPGELHRLSADAGRGHVAELNDFVRHVAKLYRRIDPKALLESAPRNATVRCLEAMTVLSIPKREFGLLAANVPGLRASFEQVTARRAGLLQ